MGRSTPLQARELFYACASSSRRSAEQHLVMRHSAIDTFPTEARAPRDL